MYSMYFSKCIEAVTCTFQFVHCSVYFLVVCILGKTLYVGMVLTQHTHFSKHNGSELPNAAVTSHFRPIHVLYECFCTH